MYARNSDKIDINYSAMSARKMLEGFGKDGGGLVKRNSYRMIPSKGSLRLAVPGSSLLCLTLCSFFLEPPPALHEKRSVCPQRERFLMFRYANVS